MDGNSLNIPQDLLEKLKELVPQAFSEGRLDVPKLQTLLGESIHIDNERYGLSWAGKSEAYKILQMPTTATLVPQPEQSVNWDESENIFIEGENLEVLKVLQKSYYGKIKMIYIDPPYNTGSDSFFKIWRGDLIENEAELTKQMELFVTPQRANAQTENILWELLIKNGVPLTEKIQQIEVGEGAVVYHTSDKRLALVLDKYTPKYRKKFSH